LKQRSCPYDDHVREIGVQELKTNLSGVLRRVGEGERVRVTRRGRYVADLLPPESDPGEAKLRKLIAEGRITPASRPFPKDAPPPRDTGRSASAFILAERDEER
jgi:prevent-host-death family protein